MAKAPKDPEMAAAKLAVAASQPSMDLLITKDPVTLTAQEIADGVAHARAQRALWTLKQERKGNATEDKTEADDGEANAA